ESVAAAQQAEDVDPIGQFGRHALALSRARRFAELEKLATSMEKTNAGVADGFMATSLYGRGREEEALAFRMKSFNISHDALRLEAYPAAYAKGGFHEVWRWELKQTLLKAQTQYVSAFDLASAYARAGETEMALRWLDKSVGEHSDRLVFLHVD